MLRIHRIRREYSQTTDLIECLRQHTSYCLLFDFDQIQQSNLIEVECCNCKREYRIEYSKVALVMFCNDCKDIKVTTEHIDNLKWRLERIKTKLLESI